VWKRINSFEKIKLSIAKVLVTFGGAKKKLEATKLDIKNKVAEAFKASKFKKLEFMDKGLPVNSILNKLHAMNSLDREMKGENLKKISGAIYINDTVVENLAGEAIRLYSYDNLLHPDVFCSARFIESQLIKLGVELFNGGKDACGVTTTGGSESIQMAMLAYRNRGHSLGIKHPEIIIPITAHAAFDKAGEAFKIKIVKIPYDPKTYQVDLNKVKRAINKNTVAIVGSFPNFPHKVADDIEGLSKIAVSYKVPLHVDGCLGGFLVAFYGNSNIKIPKFNFFAPRSDINISRFP
jgi:sphinganine-1-phosphate aldolase